MPLPNQGLPPVRNPYLPPAVSTPDVSSGQGHADPTQVGGSVAGTQGELNRTDATFNRAAFENQKGMAAQGQMQGIGNDLLARGRGQDQTAAGYLGNAQDDSTLSGADRQGQQDTLNRLRQFYQNGPGPSAAQAQLQQANAVTQNQNLALARSARGVPNGAANRNLAFQSAAQNQQTAQQSKILGAQEAADWRQQQGQAMGLEQQGLAGMRAGDLNTMGGNISGGLDYGKTAMGYGRLGADTTHQAQQIGLGYTGLAEGAATNAEHLRQNDILARSRAATSDYTAGLGYATGMNALQQQQTAGMIGAAGTVGAGLAGLAAGAGGGGGNNGGFDPTQTGEYQDANAANGNPYSDVRTKRKIIPMPENY